MMRPDVKIVIAWSGKYQNEVAQMLYDKLTAYIKSDYPLNVSFINEKQLYADVLHTANREDNMSDSVRIAKNMEEYFSNFDYAFFFFDTHPEMENENGELTKLKTPILSANLLYEYGLASSSFINRSMEKKIFCFSPSKISEETLQYIHGIDLKLYRHFPDEYNNSKDKQTEYIINHFIIESSKFVFSCSLRSHQKTNPTPKMATPYLARPAATRKRAVKSKSKE